MTRDPTPSGSPTLLVGISNPETADELVRLAATLARAEPVEILLTHVVTVATQISLTTGQSSPEVLRARDFLGRVVAVARDDGVAARALVEVARSVKEGLLAAAVSHDAEMILVGYSERDGDEDDRSDEEERFDRTMQRVARKASADVVVAKFRSTKHRRIAVPVTVDAPLRLTGVLCRALAADEETDLVFFHVADPEASEAEVRKALANRLEDAGLGGLGTLEVAVSEDPEDAIVRAVGEHDMVILGPSGRPRLLERIFSSRAHRIAESVAGSVVLAWGTDEEDS